MLLEPLPALRLISVGAVSLGYNARGQLASITGGRLDELRTYRADGRLQRIQLGGRQLDYAWSGAAGGAIPWLTVSDTLDGAARNTRYWLNGAQQLSAVEYGRNTPHGEAWERRDYTHRPDGGRLSERVEDCDWVQQFDEQGQPVWELECADQWRTALAYDAIGQVERVDTFAFVDGVEQPAHVDQIARDGYGRVTEARTGGVHKQMNWDAAGRMLSVDADGDVSTFAYDVSGMRISRSLGGVLTRSVWDSGGLLAEETGASEKTYLRGAGLVLGVHDSAALAGAQLTRMGHDHLGSPVLSVVGGADSVQRFGALGRVRSGGVEQTSGIGFTGHQLDGSGLTYAQARYYDPGLGGFLTADPWSGSLGMPRTLGRFA